MHADYRPGQGMDADYRPGQAMDADYRPGRMAAQFIIVPRR